MIAVNKTIDDSNHKRNLYMECFQNYGEFVGTIQEREKKGLAKEDSNTLLRLGKSNPDFTGVHSYEEAVELLENGWDKYVEEFKGKFNAKFKNMCEKQVRRTKIDCVGYKPVVARAVMNLPKAMVRSYKDVKKSKVINFIVEIGVSCGIKPSEIIEKMSEIVSAIAVFEKKGYRCRIEVAETFSNQGSYSKKVVGYRVMIKNESQPFDIKRIAFPLIHSAMNRVFGFAWQNSLPFSKEEYYEYGLGHPMYLWGNKFREEVENGMNIYNEKQVIVDYRTNINKLLEKGGEQ